MGGMDTSWRKVGASLLMVSFLVKWTALAPTLIATFEDTE